MPDAYEGFREFFTARRAALSRTAFFLAGSEAEGEELLQDAMAKAAARWPGLRDGNPEAWVRQVMLNAIRSRWRRRQRVAEDPTAEPPEPPEVRPADDTDAHATRELLSGALRRLTPKQRAVLYLRFYEDLSPVDAAPLLGVSVGTVKSQTSAALARLRQVAPELLADGSDTEIGVPE